MILTRLYISRFILQQSAKMLVFLCDFNQALYSYVGRVAWSVQRLATGWTVRGLNLGGGGEIFRPCPDRPWGPPSLLYNGYRVFPGGKERPGRDVDSSPPSSAVVMKESSYTSTLPMGLTACTEPQCLYKGDLYLLYFWIAKGRTEDLN